VEDSKQAQPVGSDAASAVLHADDLRRAATVRHDADALVEIFTDDFIYTHANGMREGRASYVDRIRSGDGIRYIALDRLDAAVRLFGDVAIIDGEAAMRFQFAGAAKPGLLESLYTAVWVHRSGAWRMASYASTAKPKAN